MIDSDLYGIFFQLVLATFLGAIIGIEREVKGKAAGFRTYALVALGACLFTVISIYGFNPALSQGFDPSRIASQVVVGIGFIGAGLIFVRGGTVQGLTTAAGIWTSAAVGMGVGVRMYSISIFAAFLAVFVLRVMRWFEPYFHKDDGEDQKHAAQ